MFVKVIDILCVCRLDELVSGGKDASEFLRWQEQNKQQELLAQMAEIERKHLVSTEPASYMSSFIKPMFRLLWQEGQLSREDAIIAKRSLTEQNRVRVQEMKEEADQLMQVYLQRRLEEEQGMR